MDIPNKRIPWSPGFLSFVIALCLSLLSFIGILLWSYAARAGGLFVGAFLLFVPTAILLLGWPIICACVIVRRKVQKRK